MKAPSASESPPRGQPGDAEAENDDGQQEQFSASTADDVFKQDRDRIPRADQNAGHHDQRFAQREQHRCKRPIARAGKNGCEQDHRYDSDVLEDQDPDRRPSVR